ncbi:hypothetical protein BKA81DRAFT_362284 [Phyllosticta paracitricarpa]
MGLARLSLLRTYLASSASLPRALSRAGGGEGWLLLYIWACEEAEDWCVMRYLWPKSVEIETSGGPADTHLMVYCCYDRGKGIMVQCILRKRPFGANSMTSRRPTIPCLECASLSFAPLSILARLPACLSIYIYSRARSRRLRAAKGDTSSRTSNQRAPTPSRC